MIHAPHSAAASATLPAPTPFTACAVCDVIFGPVDVRPGGAVQHQIGLGIHQCATDCRGVGDIQLGSRARKHFMLLP